MSWLTRSECGIRNPGEVSVGTVYRYFHFASLRVMRFGMDFGFDSIEMESNQEFWFTIYFKPHRKPNQRSKINRFRRFPGRETIWTENQNLDFHDRSWLKNAIIERSHWSKKLVTHFLKESWFGLEALRVLKLRTPRESERSPDTGVINSVHWNFLFTHPLPIWITTSGLGLILSEYRG